MTKQLDNSLRLFAGHQASVDDVERLLKKHEDTEKTLVAQEERVRGLSDMANSLIRADHCENIW